MKTALLITLVALALGVNLAPRELAPLALAQEQPPAPAPGAPGTGTYTALDLYIETDEPLAAYQLELAAAERGRVQIVGVEGGEHPLFSDAPYYDKRGMAGDRVILAELSTASAAELPRGRARVARVHVRFEGAALPPLELRLVTAGNAAGRRIEAKLTMEEGE